ncbi:MAG TPA: molecular chaperone TorD family protein [Negativicutes bacterium]|nr:molecular chaperone TorD family protein [Negativicutes bacterium]
MSQNVQDDSCTQKLQPILEVRVFAYDFLRRTFLQEPSQEFLTNLKQQPTLQVFPFENENKDIAQGIRKAQEYLGQHDVLQEIEYDKLHWDYTRLFIGPHELPAPPWESIHLNKDKLLFQEETRRVRLAYLKYAFLPELYQQEADDHVGLECDFMYQLSLVACEKNNSSDCVGLREVLQDQADFLDQHLLRWVPAFADQVISHASTEFYQGMAQTLKGFLHVDQIALQELLETA